MYEYRTTTSYGATLPPVLEPPEEGFRLRDFRCVTVMENETNMIADKFNSWSGPACSGSMNIPYTTGKTRNKTHQWVILWERYSNKEN